MVLRDAAGNTNTLTNDYPTSGSTIIVDIPNMKEDVQYSVYVVVTNRFGEGAKSGIVALCKLKLALVNVIATAEELCR